jgi:hypothetical protein
LLAIEPSPRICYIILLPNARFGIFRRHQYVKTQAFRRADHVRVFAADVYDRADKLVGATAATSSVVVAKPPAAVYAAPKEIIDKIKEEGMKNSKVMETLAYLSDVIGPRLTASPGMKRANEWTRDTMSKWGMENAHLEAWDRSDEVGR